MDPSSTTRNTFTTRAIQVLSNRNLRHGSSRKSIAEGVRMPVQNFEGSGAPRALSTPIRPARGNKFAAYHSTEAASSPWNYSTLNPRASPHSSRGSPRPRQRLALRASHLGLPQIKEMSLEKRAQLVCEVAGDFVLRLVRETLQPGQTKDWKASWEVLERLRSTDLFPPDGPLFFIAEEVISELPDSDLTDINLGLMRRAVELNNLAAFAFIILRPDDVGDLIEKYEGDLADQDFPRRRSQRGVSPTVAQMTVNVARRNAALLKAWKAFWSVLIEQGKRTNREAPKMWLELSTQILLTYQCPTIDPGSDPLDVLPSLSEEMAAQLLADDAIQTHCPDEQSHGESDADGLLELEREFLDKAWVKLVAGRKIEMEQATTSDMLDYYVYADFARDIAVYIQAQLSGMSVELVNWDSPQQSEHFSSPEKLPTSLHPHGSPIQVQKSYVRRKSPLKSSSGTTFAEVDESSTSFDTSHYGKSAALLPLPQSIKERIDEMPIDMNLLSSMVGDLDAQFQSSKPSTPSLASRSSRGLRHAEIATGTPRNSKQTGNQTIMGAAAAIPLPSGVASSPSFKFSTRQENASRVTWESQPPDSEHALPRDSRASETPRPSRRLQAGRTPRAQKSPRETVSGSSRSHVIFDVEDILPSDSGRGENLQNPDQDELDEEYLLPNASQMETLARVVHHEELYDEEDLLPQQSQLESPRSSQEDMDDDDILPSDSQMQTQARVGPYEGELEPDDVVPSASQYAGAADPAEQGMEWDDVLPDASQLQTQALRNQEVIDIDEREVDLQIESILPGASPMEFRNEDENDVNIDVDDVLPSESQLRAGSKTRINEHVEFVGQDGQIKNDEGMIDIPLPQGRAHSQSPSLIPVARAPPTSQHRLHSARVGGSNALGFQEPDSEEDEEDRRLLRADAREFNDLVPDNFDFVADYGAGDDNRHIYDQEDEDLYGTSRHASVSSNTPHASNALGVFHGQDQQARHRRVSSSKLADRRRPPSPRREPRTVEVVVPSRLAGRHRGRGNAYEPDPHTVDEDGLPLEEDPTLILPQGYKFEQSQIHGRKDGQLSGYSRLAGGLRWTKEQELLLYRTIQKIPLVESYPTRVMWYLHGEYGKLSRQLEQFNPQHMKDKMRTIVETRVRNNRPVVGRARFWLSKGHPDKLAFEEEVREFWYEQRGLTDNERQGKVVKFMGEVRERPKRKSKKAKKQSKKQSRAGTEDTIEEDGEGIQEEAEVVEEAEGDLLQEDNPEVDNVVDADEEEEEFVPEPEPKRPRQSTPASTRKSRRTTRSHDAGRSAGNDPSDITPRRSTRSRPVSTPPARRSNARSSPPASHTRSHRDTAPSASAPEDLGEEVPTRQLRSARSKRAPKAKPPPKPKGKSGRSGTKTKAAVNRTTKRANQPESEPVQENNDEMPHESEEGANADGHGETQEASENVRRAMIRLRVNDQAT